MTARRACAEARAPGRCALAGDHSAARGFREGGKLRQSESLRHKWRAGFNFLLHDTMEWQGYGEARRFLNELQETRRGSSFRTLMREVQRFGSYLLDHWGALDSLSGDFCDIYPSVDQLNSLEDAYDIIGDPGPLREIGNVAVSRLPGLFFWDRAGATEYVPLGAGQSMKHSLRTVFAGIRDSPVISSVSAAKELLESPSPEAGRGRGKKTRILFLCANPAGTGRLALDTEVREITQKIRMADGRDQLDLISAWAVRPDDVLQLLNEHRPHIVHFSGHGSTAGEIILSGATGKAKPVGSDALLAVFRTLRDNVRVVVLNACYSKTQANAIKSVIDCVIGDRQALEKKV